MDKEVAFLKQLRVLGQGIGDVGASVALELDDTLYIPIHDARGNVCVLLDASSSPFGTLRYTAFGPVEAATLTPWQYSSKRFDPETGFFHFPRRYYSPDLGRWISPDPLDFEDGLNLYSYVHNQPLTHIDPDGQFAFLIPLAISYAFSTAIDYALPMAVAYAEQNIHKQIEELGI